MFRLNRIGKTAAIAAIFIIAFLSPAFAEYDQDHVTRVMRGNVALMGEISEAAAAEDWFLSAQKLFAIAEGMMSIMQYDPPRGSTPEWNATLTEFVNTAFVGIGACGARDKEVLWETVSKLRDLSGQGHGAHR